MFSLDTVFTIRWHGQAPLLTPRLLSLLRRQYISKDLSSLLNTALRWRELRELVKGQEVVVHLQEQVNKALVIVLSLLN